LADPGTTYVTEDIFKLTEGLFRFESLGEKRVKGREKPIAASSCAFEGRPEVILDPAMF
jgi:hypothetical protein